MSDPRKPSYVIVTLPGPGDRGDPFGLQWTEPGVTSPGAVDERAECVALLPDGSAVVRIGGEERTVPEAQWRMVGCLSRSRQRQTLQAVRAIAQAGSPRVRRTAQAIAAAITGDGEAAALDDVVTFATRPKATDDDRTLALVAISALWLASEVTA